MRYKSEAAIAILVGLIVLIAYGVFTSRYPEGWMGNDSATYLTVARTLARTGHLEQDYIWHYNLLFDSITHPMIDRRPLTIFILAATMKLLPGVAYSYRFFYMVISAVTIALTYLLGRSLFASRAVGLMAALFVFTNEYQWSYAVTPVTEVVLQLLMSLAIYFLYMAMTGNRYLKCFVLAGIASGLAWLSRNQGNVMAAPLILTAGYIYWRRREKKAIVAGVIALLLFGLINLPWELWISRQPVDASGYKNAIYFSTTLADFYSYKADINAANFFAQPLSRLVRTYVQAFYQKVDLIMSFYSFPLIVCMGIGMVSYIRHPLLLAGSFQFVPVFVITGFLIAGVGGGCLGEYFYLLPILAVFAGKGFFLAVDDLRITPPRLKQVLTIALVLLITLYAAGKVAVATRRWHSTQSNVVLFYQELQRYIDADLGPDAAFIFQDPVMLNWYIDRPAILLPYGASLDDIVELAQRYQTGYLIAWGYCDSADGLYTGTVTDPRFTLINEFPSAACKLGYARIFAIRPDEGRTD